MSAVGTAPSAARARAEPRLRHTAEGWWLERAGPITPLAPLDGDVAVDVAVVGGGFSGLWTAWWLGVHDPGLRVAVLDSGLCGHGPSGRNGGFLNSYWYSAGNLVDRYGAAAAGDIARAGDEVVPGVVRWCEEQGVDADVRAVGHLVVSTAPAQDGAWSRAIDACRELGAADEYVALSPGRVQAICASPVFRGGALMRAAGTVDPARLALGLRERLVASGTLVFERSAVRRLTSTHGGVELRTDGGRVRAGAAVLTAGAAGAGAAPLQGRFTVASSHIVLTEPVPEVLERMGWTGGEAISDARSYLHYFRPTDDGRILFGWAGGRMAYGARLRGRIEVDPKVIARTRRDLVRFFPDLEGYAVTHAWGGPIDVSPTHLPAFGTLPGGRVHYGFGYTGNGVGPSWLGGRILASLALDRRDEVTRLALVEPPPARVPPEPFRFVGGSLIRRAFLRREAAEERGQQTDPVTALVTDIPRRLGVHIGR